MSLTTTNVKKQMSTSKRQTSGSRKTDKTSTTNKLHEKLPLPVKLQVESR